ncbi:MAG TPA: hypothetical protein PKA05_15635 [Roseiflexaceae bacterium]|nr:hypothetical protein [Roseiflexaceae bacterium]HMP41811.1 hypothetical protein [Roseiflexaceae bacterium]
MALGKLLAEQLNQLAVGSPEIAQSLRDAGGSMALVVAAPAAQATLTFADQDRYSVTFRTLEVSHGSGSGTVAAQAAALTQRLAFLEEPLTLIEQSADEQTAQVRSYPPLREGDERWYWEVVLQGGNRPSAVIGRYHWAPGMAEREAVAYPATFSLVSRIADALNEALHTNEAEAATGHR